MEVQTTTTIPDLSRLLAVYERWEKEQLEQQSLQTMRKMKARGLAKYYHGYRQNEEED